MKRNILFFLLFSIYCSAQNSLLDKSKKFIYPEIQIKSPLMQTSAIKTDQNGISTNRIKSSFSKNLLSEYDLKGHLISESSTDNLYNTKTSYKYKGDILIEKKTIIKVNKINTEKRIKEINRQADKDIKRNGIAAIENLETQDTESIYSVDLDKNDRIISIIQRDYKTVNDIKEKVKDKITKIEYSGNKITKIRTGDSKSFYEENYLYDGNLLIGKESNSGGTDPIHYQNTKIIYKYLYDKNKNLIAIYDVNQYFINGKRTDGNELSLRDSANYDDKNRIVWHGHKHRYETFKYDKNDNVIEYCEINKDGTKEIPRLKKQFEYNNRNKLIKLTETNYYGNTTSSYITEFIYENGLLKEIRKSSAKLPIVEKIIFEYNNKNLLAKKSEFTPKNLYDKNENANEFELRDEKIYLYDKKSLQIKDNFGKTLTEYTFY